MVRGVHTHDCEFGWRYLSGGREMLEVKVSEVFDELQRTMVVVRRWFISSGAGQNAVSI